MNIYLERLSKNELGLWGMYSNEVVSSSKYLSSIRSVFLRHIVKYKQFRCKLLLSSRSTNCGFFWIRNREIRDSNLGLFVVLPE
jgi:hypothetical protein